MIFNILGGVSRQLYMVLALTTSGFLTISMVTWYKTVLLEEQLQQYLDNVVDGETRLERINSLIGYGGVIHNFKNYVLRHDNKYLEQYNYSYQQLMEEIAGYRYRLSTLSAEKDALLEEASLNVIEKTFLQYNDKLPLITDAVKAAKSIKEIDDIVKVDDKPALSALNQLREHMVNLRRIQVEKTFEGLKNSRNLMLLICCIITICVIFLKSVVTNRIAHSLNTAIKITHSITKGNLTNIINDQSKDELGQLMRGLNIMQTQLSERLKDNQSAAEEALRVKTALDNASISVLIVNSSFQVIYVNQSALSFFEERQAELKAELPDFSMDSLLNKSVDILQKDPPQYRETLKSLKQTYFAKLPLEHIVLEYSVTPVFNQQGECIAWFKEFHDRTIETAIKKELNTVMVSALAGNLSQRVSVDEKSGFFHIISNNINQIMEFNQNFTEELDNVFGALVQGDLTRNIQHEYAGSYEKLKLNVNNTVKKLIEVVNLIQSTAETVVSAASEISQGNSSLSQRTEEFAASLQQTAASMEQMTSTVEQNADNASQAKELTVSARERADHGGVVVQNTVQAMEAIDQSSRKVADIIGVIDEIAFQTNLLSLNAAVEAARAGEHGRGFAVVASEVRNLAQRSATAAREIKGLIRDSVDKVKEGNRLVNQSGQTLSEIVTAVKKVSDIVADIAAASQEQAAGIRQVNKAITQMDDITQQNASLVEEITSSSETMRYQSETLQSQVAFFSTGQYSKQSSLPQQVQSPSYVIPSKPPLFAPDTRTNTAELKRISAVTRVSKNSDWEDF